MRKIFSWLIVILITCLCSCTKKEEIKYSKVGEAFSLNPSGYRDNQPLNITFVSATENELEFLLQFEKIDEFIVDSSINLGNFPYDTITEVLFDDQIVTGKETTWCIHFPEDTEEELKLTIRVNSSFHDNYEYEFRVYRSTHIGQSFLPSGYMTFIEVKPK